MAFIRHPLKVSAMHINAPAYSLYQPFADANACLIGMKVRNVTFGEGEITRTYSDDTDYCDIVFAPTAAPRSFRIDVLTGWGNFFENKSKEIAERREQCQRRKTEAARIAAAKNAERAAQRALRADNGSLQAFVAAKQAQELAAMRTLIHTRQISHLFHFTRIENLEQILTDGIVPRAALASGSFVANDLLRADGYSEASSLSIGFPNYKMFYKYRSNAPIDCAGWAVIAIDPEAMLDHPCLFYRTNAAANESVCQSQRDRAALMGEAGLQAMFAEPCAGLRNELGLLVHYTTDPQAEVLAFGNIGAEYFTGVALYGADRRTALEDRISDISPSLPILNHRDWFDARHDYKFWKECRIGQLNSYTHF
jgi:hypothetical protein